MSSLTTASVVAPGFSLLEGPRWRPDGLYVSDFFSESILRFPDAPRSGRVEVVARVPGRPSGLGFRPDGSLIAVSMLEHRLYEVVDGRSTAIADFGGMIAGLANDMLVDDAGTCYIGGFGTAGDSLVPCPLVMIDRHGSVSAAALGLSFPNGIALAPDGESLYVAETYAGRVSRFDRKPDGTLGTRTTVIDRSGGVTVSRVTEGNIRLPWLPDGLAIDSEGGLWVADAKGTGITRFDRDGTPTDVVDTGQLSVYAGALGGSDGRDLALCCAPANGTFDPENTRQSVLMAARVSVPASRI